MLDLSLQGVLLHRGVVWIEQILKLGDCERYFSGFLLCFTPRFVSNHFLIVLNRGRVSRGPFPFKFDNRWLKESGSKELIRNCWMRF